MGGYGELHRQLFLINTITYFYAHCRIKLCRYLTIKPRPKNNKEEADWEADSLY